MLVELAKLMFYAEPTNHVAQRSRGRAHRIRGAARFHYVNGVSPRTRRARTSSATL
jgi:P-type Mg2+ transporter